MAENTSITPVCPPFEQALGGAFSHLPAVTQRVHRPSPRIRFRGRADVDGPETLAGRLLSALFSLPAEARDVPVETTIELGADGVEQWERRYPTRVMRSRIGFPRAQNRTVEEHFGPCRFTLKIIPEDIGLRLELVSGRIGPVPLPGWLMPRIQATERCDGDHHLFDVTVALPGVGRLVRYRGWLDTGEGGQDDRPIP